MVKPDPEESSGRARSVERVNGLQAALFGFGYAASIPVVVRFGSVIRRRRRGWLAVHHLGVAALVAGFADRGSRIGVATNSTWLAASSLWWVLAGRHADADRKGG